MTKLIASLILVTICLVTLQLQAQPNNCPAPQVISVSKIGKNTMQVILFNPDKNYVDVEWSQNGGATFTTYKCTGRWMDQIQAIAFEIHTLMSPGYPYYGIKCGDILRFRMHCTDPLWGNCHADTNVSFPTDVVFNVKKCPSN